MKLSTQIRRPAGAAPRVPLRTLQELAEEFGIDHRCLASAMSKNGGPKPQFDKAKSGLVYYEAQPVRSWWKNAIEKRTQARGVVKEWLESNPGGSMASMSKMLGLSIPSIWKLMNDDEHLQGGVCDRVLAWKENPASLEPEEQKCLLVEVWK